MIVVSDATPLISLMKASKLEILEEFFNEVNWPINPHARLLVPHYCIKSTTKMIETDRVYIALVCLFLF